MTSLTLRPPRIGDLGWVVHRQALLYAEEYGFDARFEGLLAEIVGRFVREFDAKSERCWIAAQDGAVAGSVFLCRADETTAKLRLLYVEPSARGAGVGRRLVDACVSTARELGYRTLTLWTNDIHLPARALYARAGFACIERENLTMFGREMVGETWALELGARPGG